MGIPVEMLMPFCYFVDLLGRILITTELNFVTFQIHSVQNVGTFGNHTGNIIFVFSGPCGKIDYNGNQFCHFSNTFRAKCWIVGTKEWLLEDVW